MTLKINNIEINTVDDLANAIEQDKNILTQQFGNCYGIYLYIVFNGIVEMLEYLEKYFSDVKDYRTDGMDAYLCAASVGKIETMKYLEDKHNWSRDVKDNNDKDAYSIAYN
jgi:hypothetical protein